MYKVLRNPKYDYTGESYGSLYPNLHKYPATMLPQIGIDLLKEIHTTSGVLLDPYCGSGSSFASALECGIMEMHGYDINPLAVLLSQVKFTKLPVEKIAETRNLIYKYIGNIISNKKEFSELHCPRITNIDFWFSKDVVKNLLFIKNAINQITDKNLKNFFLLPFSETVRECSYTRNNEFKLFRIKKEDISAFNPDVVSVYFKKLDNVFSIYNNCYLPKLEKNPIVKIYNKKFTLGKEKYDVVLTSPPYGDSRTTVAYGQFSTLSNEWLGISNARKIDSFLMGGVRANENINRGIIADYIREIDKSSPKRALEVSSFYNDLGNSIKEVAQSVKKNGKVIYIVGNRTVKNIHLPTDQFIAEQFEIRGFKHLFTYERALSNKVMPTKNSPTNKKGFLKNTMLSEFIVVCEKTNN